jgi:hypothetical protein
VISARGAGLPPELGDARRDVHVEVRAHVGHPGHPLEVLGVAPDVGRDERRVLVASDQRFERIDQTLEPGERRMCEPLRMGEQLLEALVSCIRRIEERDRVGSVDEDGDLELRGGPHTGARR